VREVGVVVAAVILAGGLAQPAWAGMPESPTLDDARRTFYNGRYADADAIAASLCTSEVAALAACELRTSALLFQLRRALGESSDTEKAFAQCHACRELLSTFLTETRRVQAVARAHLKVYPRDEETLFFLAKLDLNYVWLQLGTLGRKTGWDEYWEARRSLDSVLKLNPHHVRAKVARAWIDYIVDTKMPRGTRWVLGGGNKKRGLRAVREAAIADADLFVRAEAAFALWDMQVRERNIVEALTTAATLARDFPANPELRRFLDAHTQPPLQ
jgi:hypothetical protein